MAISEEKSSSSSTEAHPPKLKWWLDAQRIKHKGYWFKQEFITASEAIQTQFHPLPSDIILASFPKTGTTWLKSLTASILSHEHPTTTTDVPQSRNPHELVPFLEIETFGDNPSRDITTMPSPRVFNTHLSLSFLPETVKTSGCKVIYITRHPADTFVSLWHIYKNKFGTQASIREAYDEFCQGFVPAGPYFKHVLEFWLASQDADDTNNNSNSHVLFVTYEDLKANPRNNVKRIAEFLGCSSGSADSNGEIDMIVEECSFEKQSKIEANRESREDVHWSGTKFGLFFRKGVVGDWKSHLSIEMVQELEKIGQINWAGTGLDPKIFGSQSVKMMMQPDT